MFSLEKKIKLLLSEQKITQKELCQKIGMSDQNLRKIFNRNSIETKHLFKISEALGVSVGYFFDGEANSNSNQEIIENSENSKLKDELIVELKRNNEFYFYSLTSLYSDISDLYVDMIEENSNMKDFLNKHNSTKRLLARINTMKALSGVTPELNKKFFDYIENPF